VKTTTLLLALFVAAAAGIGGGYVIGMRSQTSMASGEPASGTTQDKPAARKVLYYRNPMGLADTSPTPKKDPMGMDYVPVYEGEDESKDPASPNQIRISTEKIQKLGVRVEAASMRQLGRSVRAAGRVEPDEEINLQIQLPSGEWLRLQGRVASYQPGVGFGIAFTSLNKEKTAVLKELIATTKEREI